MSRWQVQEAKAELSSLIRAAETEGPQTITRSGKSVAVVLSAQDYAALKRRNEARRGSLLEFFETWPAVELPPRDVDDVGRSVEI